MTWKVKEDALWPTKNCSWKFIDVLVPTNTERNTTRTNVTQVLALSRGTESVTCPVTVATPGLYILTTQK